jgi:mRNA interferase MazF
VRIRTSSTPSPIPAPNEARRDLDDRGRQDSRGQAPAGGDSAGRPLRSTASITVCAFTTDPTDAPLFRLLVEPSAKNGLRAPRRLMVDKITTVPKAKVGTRVGRLDDEDILRLNRAIVVFLGLAGPASES